MEKIRDKGKSEREAQAIQEIVNHLGEISLVVSVGPIPLPVVERPDAGQLDRSVS